MPVIRAYGCVRCQQYHYEYEAMFVPHIFSQCKHGIQWFPDPREAEGVEMVYIPPKGERGGES